jgi:hypothetical protein
VGRSISLCWEKNDALSVRARRSGLSCSGRAELALVAVVAVDVDDDPDDDRRGGESGGRDIGAGEVLGDHGELKKALVLDFGGENEGEGRGDKSERVEVEEAEEKEMADEGVWGDKNWLLLMGGFLSGEAIRRERAMGGGGEEMVMVRGKGGKRVCVCV